MRTRLPAAALVLLASLLAVSPAAAATPTATELTFKVGRECAANNGIPDVTLIPREFGSESVQFGDVPLDGVLTQWKIRFSPPEGLEGTLRYPETLKVMKAVEGEELPEAQVVAESAQETVVPGVNTFKTRIPVKAGEFFGLWGGVTTPALFCDQAGEGERMAYSNTQGDLAIGAHSIFESAEAESQVPILATVEADVDGDGYGDVSQDKCPASPATHGPCPALHARWQVNQRAIVVWVSAAKPMEVTVNGEARWHFKPKPKPKPSLPKGTSLVVGLDGGGTKTVQRPTPFRLKLGRTVLRRLDRLTPWESVQARIALATVGQGGHKHQRLLRFRLHGRRR